MKCRRCGCQQRCTREKMSVHVGGGEARPDASLRHPSFTSFHVHQRRHAKRSRIDVGARGRQRARRRGWQRFDAPRNERAGAACVGQAHNGTRQRARRLSRAGATRCAAEHARRKLSPLELRGWKHGNFEAVTAVHKSVSAKFSRRCVCLLLRCNDAADYGPNVSRTTSDSGPIGVHNAGPAVGVVAARGLLLK